MNKANAIALTLGLLLCSTVSMAGQQPDASPASKMLIYISPQEYTNSVLLRHVYYQYWFEQGPQVEALAKTKFSAEFGDVAMCEGAKEGNTLVWLKPSIFYNPVARSYFGRMIAEVYSGDGKPLGTYTAKVQHPGSIDINTVGQVNAVYSATINDVVRQIAANQDLQQAMNYSTGSASHQIPCSTVALYSPRKPFSFY